MTRKRMVIIAGSVVVLAGAAAGGSTAALTGGDNDQALAGDTLQKATEAALGHTNGGTVIETEVGDDGAAYGVEVRLDDGRVVEVNLGPDFTVVGQEADDDGPNDADGPNDD